MATPLLISIVLATYNGEKYLREQLDSLLNQTHKSLEIIVVDDCSKDSTINIIKEYQQQNPNIFLFINPKNLGPNKTFEAGILKATGDFVAFCDQDDIWMPNKIETLLNAVGKEDAYYSNSLLVNAKGESLGTSFKQIMNLKSYYTGAPFLLSNCVPGHTMLVKRNFLLSILPIPSITFFDMWIGYAAAATNGIKFIDEVLVHYRQHDSNTIGTSKSKNKRKKRTSNEEFEFKKNELKLLATIPITNEYTKNVLQQMLHHFHRKWSLSRSIFFFKNFNTLLASKQKPTFRKVLYCIKMFFKPNF